MQFILDTLIENIEKNAPVITGAIIRSSGSVPRSSGARMLVLQDGTLHGTVGGGAVEGKCHKVAREMLISSENFRIAEFTMTATDAAAEGMICGGSVSVLLQKLGTEHLEILQRLRDKYRSAQQPCLVTTIFDGGKPPEISIFDETEQDFFSQNTLFAIKQKSRKNPFIVKEGGTDFFIEPLIHPGVVYIVGAGHVAYATARLAAFTGFEVVVMDDRREFANNERYPEAKEIHVLDNFDNCLADLGPGDYVVIVTRGHMHDRDVLAQALKTEAGYIGMIGSKRKRKAIYGSLLASGFTEADLKRVYSPIGLSIGADTPEEIGISIVAELVQVRSGSV